MMKTKRSLLLGWMGLVALVVGALGDNQPAQKRQQQRSSPLAKEGVRVPIPESDSPIIGYLEKRRQTITIKSGPQGTLYSIKTTEGTTLFENLTTDQLRAAAPELHELIRTAVAADSEKGSVLMDARVRAVR
jgi:hypothetical protein